VIVVVVAAVVELIGVEVDVVVVALKQELG